MRFWVTRAGKLLFPVLAFVLPSRCFVCRELLGRRQHRGACLRCWAALASPGSPRCRGCGLAAPTGTDLLAAAATCIGCRHPAPSASAVRTALIYDDRARRFLVRAKLGGRPELLPCLGELLAADLRVSRFHAGCNAVVAVPSHPWLNLRRGFQPAAEIARRVAGRLGLPLRRWLRRRLSGIAQAKRMGAVSRQRSAPDRFSARRIGSGARILLIDDLMTTGATAEACSRTLLEAGALEVRVAVWAQVPATFDHPHESSHNVRLQGEVTPRGRRNRHETEE